MAGEDGAVALASLLAIPESINNQRKQAVMDRAMYRGFGVSPEQLDALAPGPDKFEPLGGEGTFGRILSGAGSVGAAVAGALGHPIAAPRIKAPEYAAAMNAARAASGIGGFKNRWEALAAASQGDPVAQKALDMFADQERSIGGARAGAVAAANEPYRESADSRRADRMEEALTRGFENSQRLLAERADAAQRGRESDTQRGLDTLNAMGGGGGGNAARPRVVPQSGDPLQSPGLTLMADEHGGTPPSVAPPSGGLMRTQQGVDIGGVSGTFKDAYGNTVDRDVVDALPYATQLLIAQGKLPQGAPMIDPNTRDPDQIAAIVQAKAMNAGRLAGAKATKTDPNPQATASSGTIIPLAQRVAKDIGEAKLANGQPFLLSEQDINAPSPGNPQGYPQSEIGAMAQTVKRNVMTKAHSFGYGEKELAIGNQQASNIAGFLNVLPLVQKAFGDQGNISDASIRFLMTRLNFGDMTKERAAASVQNLINQLQTIASSGKRGTAVVDPDAWNPEPSAARGPNPDAMDSGYAQQAIDALNAAYGGQADQSGVPGAPNPAQQMPPPSTTRDLGNGVTLEIYRK